MNAKIVITVPLETVPRKVSELLSELSNKLSIQGDLLEYSSRNISSAEDLLKQIENLDNIRKELSLIDNNIEDCYSILKGFITYKYSSQQGKEDDKDEPSTI